MNTQHIFNGISEAGFHWVEKKEEAAERPVHVEAAIGEPNFRQIWWLARALEASERVARVWLPQGTATGFLVGPDAFMTNHHVLEEEQDACDARLQFDYRSQWDGTPNPIDVWECDPDNGFMTNPYLDYTVVRVKSKDGVRPGDQRGFCALRHGKSARVGHRVNLIQHPKGRFQEIAFRDNQVEAVSDITVQYLTDTDFGTSGSPVFDDWFNVVALHNQRVPDPGFPWRYHRNQGFRIESILADEGNALIP